MTAAPQPPAGRACPAPVPGQASQGGEFDLIARWFTRPVARAELGVGDDCALLRPAPGMQLAVSCDMLVEGRHYLSTVPPRHLGHKALAVNLSDLAACGAKPLAFTLALALPRLDEAFLDGFAAGLFELADAQGIELVGGDTTAGPANVCITVFGEVPAGQALLRSGARPGDALWVSGELGGARLALENLRGRIWLDAEAAQATRARLECPQPRVALGLALRGIASAAIDLSDGLLGDLGHVLGHSRVGAVLDWASLPLAAQLRHLPEAVQQQCSLAGGDDYELLFAAPVAAATAVQAAAAAACTPVSCIGRIVAEPGLELRQADGQLLALDSRWQSFDHFRT